MTDHITISPDNVVGYLKHRPMLKARVDRMFRRHVAACKTLGADITPYARFACEVLSASRAAREDMLSPQAPPRYQPLRRYSQYETGRQEQFARRRPRTETP